MATVTERIDPERAWAGAVVALVAALVGGAIAFPRRVYDGFIWQYFWGPVLADAKSAVCAVRADGATRYLYDASACRAATGPVAEPGYTVVSEVGYAVTLLIALVGVVFLLRRLDVGEDRRFFYTLFPFALFGGALRVVEDVNDGAAPGFDAAISFPWNTLIISPVIYFTMFALALAALVGCVLLAREGAVDRYDLPLGAVGTALFAVTLGYLTTLAFTTDAVSWYPQIAIVVLLGATFITAGVWEAVDRTVPEINRGTGRIGAVILWGHTVDGVANVVGIDWASELGAPGDLSPKHPVNRALIDVGRQFPDAVVDLVGAAWPFLVVKVVAALFVIWVFDERMFEESPRYAILLLVAILAVGLGPGTRDLLRATFWV